MADCRPGGGDPDPQGGGARWRAGSRRSTRTAARRPPGLRLRQPSACRAASEQGRMHPNRPRVRVRVLRQGHLGVHTSPARHAPCSPGTSARTRSLGRSGRRRVPPAAPAPRRPAASGAGRNAGPWCRRRASRGVPHPGLRCASAGRECTVTARRPASSGAPSGAAPGRHPARGGPAARAGSARRGGRTADLVTGAQHQFDEGRCRAAAPCPCTAWSASHGWVARESPPGEEHVTRRRRGRRRRPSSG